MICTIFLRLFKNIYPFNPSLKRINNLQKYIIYEFKMDEFQNMKKLRYTHIFQEDIANIFTMIKEHAITTNLFEQFYTNLEYLDDSTNIYTQSGKFKILWNNYLPLVCTCIDYQDKQTHKKISWRVNEQTTNCQLVLNLNIFPSTIDLTTVVICELFYEDNTFILKNIVEPVDTAKQEILNKLDYCLKNNMTNVQIETIMVKSNREAVWDLITDWSEFQKKVPLIADKVVYEGEEKMLGSTLTIYKGSKFECTLQVIVVENDPDNFIWEFGLNCVKSNPPVPNQEIYLIVERLEKELTLVTFKHFFKQNVTWTLLNALSKEKKKILKTLKDAFSNE
jgi:hypothetical protein